MIVIANVIGKFALALPVPGPRAGAMGVLQRNQVVNVQLPRISRHLSGVRPLPASRRHPAFVGRLKRYGDGGLGNQHFLPGILAIAVFIGPVTPFATVVFREVLRNGSNRDLQDQPGPRLNSGFHRL